jgi:uncharacterized protein
MGPAYTRPAQDTPYRDTARAMSQESVEIVRRVFELAARRDNEAVLALYHPDVEWDMTRSMHGLGGGIYHGHDGLRAFAREFYTAFENLEDRPDELIPAGAAVVSVSTQIGRGRTSGVEVRQPLAAVWTIREGKVARVVWHRSRAEALEAVGLSE